MGMPMMSEAGKAAFMLQKEAGVTPRENALMAYSHKIPYWIPNIFLDLWTVQPVMEVERYFGHDKGEDAWGVEWTYVEEMGAPMPTPGKHLFEDIADWEANVRFPDLESIDWKAHAEDDLRIDMMATGATGQKIYMKDGRSINDPNKLGMAMILNGMFERLHSMMGFDNALMGLASDEDAAYAYFEKAADYKIKFFQKVGEHYPVDIINAHDDYGASDRMLMSPDTWRRLIKPNLKRMVDAVHDMGLIYQHHSCGCIDPIVEDLIEIGVDAWDPVQTGNKNVHADPAKYQNRLTLVGGMDNQKVVDQPDATPEKIIESLTKTTDNLAPQGSYIALPSIADHSRMPIVMEQYFRYDVPFYKNRGLGPWA